MNFALNATNEITDIELDKIMPCPYQPRRFYDRERLGELARSIRQYGVIQPVCVRKTGSLYELVTGERRLRASKIAGLRRIPSVVLEAGDRDCAALCLIENIHRQRLDFMEEAEALKALMRDFNCTVDELAHITDMSRLAIAEKLRLTRLSPDVRQIITHNALTEEHARALLSLHSTEAQKKVLAQVIKHRLDAESTRDAVESCIKQGGEVGVIRRRPHIKMNFKDIRLFADTLRRAVEQMNTTGIKTQCEIKQDNNIYSINIRLEKE